MNYYLIIIIITIIIIIKLIQAYTVLQGGSNMNGTDFLENTVMKTDLFYMFPSKLSPLASMHFSSFLATVLFTFPKKFFWLCAYPFLNVWDHCVILKPHS